LCFNIVIGIFYMKILIANWKMNPKTEAEAIRLAKAEDISGAVLCPPFPFLPAVKKVLKKAALGAQDAFWEGEGPFTGEISPVQLKKIGVHYVIIGHSERRLHAGETNEMIAAKMVAALSAGLLPILCVGETAQERAEGKTADVLALQLRLGLSRVREQKLSNPFLIAYEPVWSISTFRTGQAATPEDISNVIPLIESFQGGSLASFGGDLPAGRQVKILYGGSVDAKTLAGFLAIPGISGALVGAASLKAGEFGKMILITAQSISSQA